ncbi:MAG: hypothetical protein IKU01_01365 [Bacteroidales bacterium]|nr:hypothetical protein [Bacteroidales bacterium]
MEYQEDYDLEQETPEKRPEMLTVLCILSFINAVYNGIVNFVSFAFYDTIVSLFDQMKNGEGVYADLSEQLGDSWAEMAETAAFTFSVGSGYYFIEMLLFIASFIGVLMMWRLQKKGFHVYTISQILMLITTSVFVVSKVGGGFPFVTVLLTALFVMMYFSHYKKVMK